MVKKISVLFFIVKKLAAYRAQKVNQDIKNVKARKE